MAIYFSGGGQMNASKIAFVILHYQAVESTKKSIESVLKNVSDNFIVIVVDNASPNESGVELQKYFEQHPNVIVLLNLKNIGFADGNNLGYLFAKKNYGADYIILMNNDIFIQQNDFAKRIVLEFESSHYFVLSPNQTGAARDWAWKEPWTHFLKVYIFSYQTLYWLLKMKLTFLFKIFSKVWWFTKKHFFDEPKKKIDFPIPRMEGIEPLGSCLIFSPLFVDAYDGLDTRTSFYHEEDVLYAKLFARKQKMVYHPEIQVFHDHHASTRVAHSNAKERSLWVLKNMLTGLKVYRQVLVEEGLLKGVLL
jgi:GT2 family glycosyltransferase